MSRFRAPPPPGAPSTPEQFRAELAAFERAASDELMLRIRYNLLKCKLRLIDTYDPVPDEIRASLTALPSSGAAGPGEEAET